jgi:hypothetical protein
VIGLGTLCYMLWGLALFLYPRTRTATLRPPTTPGEPGPSDTTPT